MADIEIQAEPRVILGKNVAKLRRAGVTPAHIFGHNVDSRSIQVSTIELTHALRAAGGTRLVQLTVAGEREPRNVLVRHISRKPTTDQLLHVDFYEVSMTEKTAVEVPVVLVGEAPIAESGDGMVFQQINSITVECLPANIPDRVEADVSTMSELHSTVHGSDLKLPANVTTTLDPGEVVASISRRMEAEEEVEAEAAASEEVEEAASGAAESEQSGESEGS
jgi:large subunit ribosomal protein L25